MAGLVPAIHVLRAVMSAKTWMPGTRPGMTEVLREIRGDAERHAASWVSTSRTQYEVP